MKKDEPQETIRTLTDLDQIRVLAHPLRLRIVGALCTAELTTKQVAEKLGEKPTKLYHHVEILEKAGLIRLKRTRPNRGTLEKYYEAVAGAFQADSALFSTPDQDAMDPEVEGSLAQMVGTVIDTTKAELLRLARSGKFTDHEEGIISFVEIRAGQKEVDELRSRVNAVIDYLREMAETSDPDEEIADERHFRMTLACFPLDRFDE